MLLKHHVCLSPKSVSVDGELLEVAVSMNAPESISEAGREAVPTASPNTGANSAQEMLHALYRQYVKDYPKFFKMDLLGKLGFVASELLLQREGAPRFVPCEERAVICFNRSASLVADSRFQETIQHDDSDYPSPSLFVYTLPNIVTGEIAIRNKYYGETSFVVLEKFDPEQIAMMVDVAFQDPGCQSQIVGWTECADESHWHCLMLLVEREGEMNLHELAACLENLYRTLGAK